MSKGKTATLPGMEEAVHPDVRDAGLKLVNSQAARMAATEQEIQDRAHLKSVMKEHGPSRYFDADVELFCFIEKPSEEKAKVRMGEAALNAAKEYTPVDSPVTSPGPDVPIGEDTLKPFPKAAAEDE
jgi:hypothetical protein